MQKRQGCVASNGENVSLGQYDFPFRPGPQQTVIRLLDDLFGLDGWKPVPEIPAESEIVRLNRSCEPEGLVLDSERF